LGNAQTFALHLPARLSNFLNRYNRIETVTIRHRQITKAAILCLLTPSAVPFHAQTSTPTPPLPKDQSFYVNQPPTAAPKPTRNVIVIDPAHGGDDPGAQLPNNAVEKEVTQAFAARLKPLLTTAGFTILTTHDTDADLSTEIRAGIANHARATACLILHATSSGTGIHIATSALPDNVTPPHNPIPWNTAQTAYLPQSLRLVNEIGLAFDGAKLPVLLIRASTPPLDNLTCPAVVIELAPLNPDTPVTDTAYQQQAAQAIAAALTSYRTHNAPAAGSVGAPR
jgi:N-acetylmuramoyl-L-alanine amidase